MKRSLEGVVVKVRHRMTSHADLWPRRQRGGGLYRRHTKAVSCQDFSGRYPEWPRPQRLPTSGRTGIVSRGTISRPASARRTPAVTSIVQGEWHHRLICKNPTNVQPGEKCSMPGTHLLSGSRPSWRWMRPSFDPAESAERLAPKVRSNRSFLLNGFQRHRRDGPQSAGPESAELPLRVRFRDIRRDT